MPINLSPLAHCIDIGLNVILILMMIPCVCCGATTDGAIILDAVVHVWLAVGLFKHTWLC